MDLDDCGLKPKVGDNAEECVVRIVSSCDAYLAISVAGLHEEGGPREVDMRWKPAGPIEATASGDCSQQGVATVLSDANAGMYRSFQVVTGMFDGAILKSMARGGILRPGVYVSPRDPDGDDTSWKLFIGAGPSCDADSVMLETAREQIAAAARDVLATFLAIRALTTLLSTDPVAAEVGSFFATQQGQMISAFAARGTALGAAARDAADAAYGRAVAVVMAPHAANVARLSTAGISSPDRAPRDPRFVQLSSLMSQLALQAQALQRWQSDVERSRERYADCVKR